MTTPVGNEAPSDTEAAHGATGATSNHVPPWREGVVDKTTGEDGHFVEDVRIVQCDAAEGHFLDVGELITSFRSS